MSGDRRRVFEALHRLRIAPRANDRGYVERMRLRREEAEVWEAETKVELARRRALPSEFCPDHPLETAEEDGEHICCALGCRWRSGAVGEKAG